RRVRHQPAIHHMRVRLADQPLLVVPRAAAALAGDALDMALRADIVGAEGDERALRAHLDMVVLSAAVRAGLAAAPTLGLRARTRGSGHRPPGRLRLPDVAFCSSPLFARCHGRLLILPPRENA